MDATRAAWKFLRSFFKRSWELSDYPIRVREFSPRPEPHGRSGPPFTWSAQIVHWWTMSGHGYSREEALGNLAENFARRKSAADRLPRPGTKVPLTFTSNERIKQHEALAAHFLDHILGLRYEECFISDQSSLWNFHDRESNDFLHKRVAHTYGVDISDLESALMPDILERIAAQLHVLPNKPLQPTSGASTTS